MRNSFPRPKVGSLDVVVDVDVDMDVDDLFRMSVGNFGIRRLVAGNPHPCVHDQHHVHDDVHVHDVTAWRFGTEVYQVSGSCRTPGGVTR